MYVIASIPPARESRRIVASVALIALAVRYCVTPSQTKTLLALSRNPLAVSAAARSSRSKSAVMYVTCPAGRPRRPMTERLTCCVTGWSTSKTRRPASAASRCARVSYPAPSRTHCSQSAAACTTRSSITFVRAMADGLTRGPATRS